MTTDSDPEAVKPPWPRHGSRLRPAWAVSLSQNTWAKGAALRLGTHSSCGAVFTIFSAMAVVAPPAGAGPAGGGQVTALLQVTPQSNANVRPGITMPAPAVHM